LIIEYFAQQLLQAIEKADSLRGPAGETGVDEPAQDESLRFALLLEVERAALVVHRLVQLELEGSGQTGSQYVVRFGDR
jgi:hypothetical protein